nr:sP-TLR6 [Cyclina sinensis]
MLYVASTCGFFVLTALIGMAKSASCPRDCICKSNTISCQGNLLKKAIPDGITKARLTSFLPEPKETLSKVHESWASVETLEIDLEFPGSVNYLADKSFRGLRNLTYLGIHGIVPKNPPLDFFFNSETFYELDNLETLDLSGNTFLYLTEVTKSLSTEDTLPKLKTINLINIQSLTHKPIYRAETSAFLESLHSRKIKQLILDGAEFEIDFSYMRNLCKSVEVISMKHSRVFGLHKADFFACASLKELDLTNASVPFLQFLLRHPIQPFLNFVNIFNRYESFLFSVEKLSLDNFLPPDPKPLSFDKGFVFDAGGINLRVKYLNFRNNFLQNLNVSFRHMPFPKGTEIDVSGNNIEFIHTRSVDPGTGLRKINLESNKLYKMRKEYPGEFAVFLHVFTDLEDINLSYNKLTSLPRNTFSKNLCLKSINLSGNLINILSFDIKSLSNLQLLDLSENGFTGLSKREMTDLEKHVHNFSASNFVLNIRRNNFTCQCDRLSFIVWFKDSTFVSGEQKQYFCKYDDNLYDLKGDALEQIENECKLKLLKRNLVIGLSFCFCLIILTVLLIISFLRYRKKQNKIKTYLGYLRSKDESHFLAFLSYASEDTEFVMSQLANKLNDSVCIRTKRKAEYICIGDKHFRPGFPVITEIMCKMENSAVAVFVISQTFCDKSWCHIEAKEAMDLQKPVVLIFKEKIDETQMPDVVRKLFRLNTRCRFVQEPNGNWTLQPSFDVLTTSLIELAVGTEKFV